MINKHKGYAYMFSNTEFTPLQLSKAAGTNKHHKFKLHVPFKSNEFEE